MDSDTLNLTFASSLTDLCEINPSFDTGILRVAYHGANQNKSSISKETFEKCLKTIYNCPIVCNYDRDTNTLGGHDVELIYTDDGDLKMVQLTQPVGVVPESAKTFWQTITEENGTEHEYLCVEVILWKRQEAYQLIKENGITAESMEINITDGKKVDGIYQITDFYFKALTLIGITPCYESAALTFSKDDFKQEFSQMMLELKDTLEDYNKKVTTSKEVDTINKQKSMEGGNNDLSKQELIEKYSINVDTLDFSIDDFSIEELELKFKAIADSKTEPNKDGKFALASAVTEELNIQLSAIEQIHCDWGDYPRYLYVDHDVDTLEVYCWDRVDWLLYGFKYSVNGDTITIDAASKTRKKYSIVDFDEGEQNSPFAEIFDQMSRTISEESSKAAEFEEKFQAATDSAKSMESELNELKEFKASAEQAALETERKTGIADIFSKFTDLENVEEFSLLKDECDKDCMKYKLDDLETLCYAIRGKQGVPSNFSLTKKTPKLPVIPKDNNRTDEPYGGVFEEFGFSTKQ